MRALRNSAGLLTVFILVMALSAAKPLIEPPSAQALPGIPGIPGVPGPCSLIPDSAARTACNAATDPVGTAVGAIPGIPNPTDVINGAADAIVQTILNQVAKAESDAVSSVLTHVTQFVNNSTAPNLTAEWFLRLYAIVFAMAIPLGIVLFYTRVGMAVKNSEASEVVLAFSSLAGLLVLGGLLPGLVGLLVHALDDQVAPGFMASAGSSANDTLGSLSVDFNKDLTVSNNAATPILLPLIFLFFGLIGGILIELMLLFREAMLYVITAAEIVAIAMLIGGRITMNRFMSTTRKLLVLCFFKVIMSFILTVGLLLFSSSGAPPVLLGSVVLLMVPILSWGAYRSWGEHDIRFLPGGATYTQSAVRRLGSGGS